MQCSRKLSAKIARFVDRVNKYYFSTQQKQLVSICCTVVFMVFKLEYVVEVNSIPCNWRVYMHFTWLFNAVFAISGNDATLR